MRVLALVPGGISNQILFFPTLDDLQRVYPHAKIDVVVEPKSKAAYSISSSVHEVLTFDYQDSNSLADWGNLVGTIRDREYQVVLSVPQTWFIGLLLWLTGIPTRIAYQGVGANFFTDTVALKVSQYAAAKYHDLLQPLGINTPVPELQVNILKSDMEWARHEQTRLEVNQTGYILIYDGSNQSSRDITYPQESWQEIIRACQHKQPDLPIVVVQDANNQQFVRSLLDHGADVKVISPDSIGQLTAIIAGASLMLTVEGVPLQLAVAVQTYTITLFGATEPATLLPKSDKFLAIKSPSSRVADIARTAILDKIWGN